MRRRRGSWREAADDGECAETEAAGKAIGEITRDGKGAKYMRYALYIESTNKYSVANTQDYGWYTGITYKVKGITYPVCDAGERPNKRTKIYKSLYTAKIVGESLIRKCPFIDGYKVAKLIERKEQ